MPRLLICPSLISPVSNENSDPAPQHGHSPKQHIDRPMRSLQADTSYPCYLIT
ncbi:Uncharacterized protein DAT39_012324 [Clarias magur]|uniref:Uncharacterized protein n=1 Tax=Clarias magur TaxID=1594786 RepID=A0A8J4WZ07_CLAMG|nr:Uncharacterized protein DAT39_012324 [Clarias magur]